MLPPPPSRQRRRKLRQRNHKLAMPVPVAARRELTWLAGGELCQAAAFHDSVRQQDLQSDESFTSPAGGDELRFFWKSVKGSDDDDRAGAARRHRKTSDHS